MPVEGGPGRSCWYLWRRRVDWDGEGPPTPSGRFPRRPPPTWGLVPFRCRARKWDGGCSASEGFLGLAAPTAPCWPAIPVGRPQSWSRLAATGGPLAHGRRPLPSKGPRGRGWRHDWRGRGAGGREARGGRGRVNAPKRGGLRLSGLHGESPTPFDHPCPPRRHWPEPPPLTKRIHFPFLLTRGGRRPDAYAGDPADPRPFPFGSPGVTPFPQSVKGLLRPGAPGPRPKLCEGPRGPGPPTRAPRSETNPFLSPERKKKKENSFKSLNLRVINPKSGLTIYCFPEEGLGSSFPTGPFRAPCTSLPRRAQEGD